MKSMQNNSRTVFINTCIFGTEKMPLIADYARQYRGRIGFEVLSMFDLPAFELELESLIPVLETCPVTFHGPVYCVEHSAPRGSAAYEETMYHIRKTITYAERLHSGHLTMHLNNCVVEEGQKQAMLCNALENYKELADLFGAFGCRVFVENTGTKVQKNMLLDQDEFTELCIRKDFEVLIDIGHANANGWDVPRLIRDLKGRVRAFHLHNNDGIHDQHNRLRDGTLDFDAVMKVIAEETPEADRIIEYIRPDQEGEGLREDIELLLGLA